MDRHNLGFALFLILLLLVPELPLGQEGGVRSSMSVGAVGLVLWLMLSNVTFVSTRSMGFIPVYLIVLFGFYLLLVSLGSGEFTSIAYALQYCFYAVLGGFLISGYVAYKSSRGQLRQAFTIFGWVGAIYGAAILISIWTGPLTPFQYVRHMQHFGGLEFSRGVGVAESVNLAGGVAAVFASFQILVWSRIGRLGTLLILLGLAALAVTLSRSAILSFVLGFAAFGALLLLRVMRTQRVGGQGFRTFGRLIGILLLILMMPLMWLLADDTARNSAVIVARGLGADATVAAADVDSRLAFWRGGLEQWAAKPAYEQFLGSGFRNSARVRNLRFGTSHNSYIEFLNDAGVVGLFLFCGAMLIAISRLSVRIIVIGSDPISAFCLITLVTICLHAGAEVYLYYPATVSLLIFILAVAGLLPPNRNQAGVSAQAPPPRSGGGLARASAGGPLLQRPSPQGPR